MYLFYMNISNKMLISLIYTLQKTDHTISVLFLLLFVMASICISSDIHDQ